MSVDESEWERLRQALSLSSGFDLLLVRVDDSSVEFSVCAAIRGFAHDVLVNLVEVDVTADAPIEQLLRGPRERRWALLPTTELARTRPDAIWRLLLQINQRRDLLSETWNGALLLLLDPDTLALLPKLAPDLYSIHRAQFTFARSPEIDQPPPWFMLVHEYAGLLGLDPSFAPADSAGVSWKHSLDAFIVNEGLAPPYVHEDMLALHRELIQRPDLYVLYHQSLDQAQQRAATSEHVSLSQQVASVPARERGRLIWQLREAYADQGQSLAHTARDAAINELRTNETWPENLDALRELARIAADPWLEVLIALRPGGGNTRQLAGALLRAWRGQAGDGGFSTTALDLLQHELEGRAPQQQVASEQAQLTFAREMAAIAHGASESGLASLETGPALDVIHAHFHQCARAWEAILARDMAAARAAVTRARSATKRWGSQYAYLRCDLLTHELERRAFRYDAAHAWGQKQRLRTRAARHLGPVHPGYVDLLLALAEVAERRGDAEALASLVEELALRSSVAEELGEVAGRALALIRRHASA